MALKLAGPSQAATDELPNLTPLPASDIMAVQSGSTLTMRFAALNWNNGSGRLEVWSGAEDKEAGRQKVYQRIYSGTGTRDVLAGSFVYHEAHQHIHFDDFALYTLQPVNAPGASQRTSAKTTFCIMDTDHIDAGLAGSPSSPRYITCNGDVQGMSVGWGDKYGNQLVGQGIDVTGLPDGLYNLKIEVDPNNRIVESDESDNVSNRVVKKSGNSITPDPTVAPTPDPTPDPTVAPTPDPTVAPDPTSTTATSTEPPREVQSPPVFATGRLSRAAWRERYREVVRFSGATESVRLRGLPRGLAWTARQGRIEIRGKAQRRGRFDVRVVLVGPDVTARRTFRLTVR